MVRSCHAVQVKYDADLRPSPIVPTRSFYLTVTALRGNASLAIEPENSQMED